MALGNVNDAPIRLNMLLLENVRLALPVLQERAVLHYSQQFTSQLYRVLGSADFLGNPIGLFQNVSSGVADAFYAPYEGLVGGDVGATMAKVSLFLPLSTSLINSRRTAIWSRRLSLVSATVCQRSPAPSAKVFLLRRSTRNSKVADECADRETSRSMHCMVLLAVPKVSSQVWLVVSRDWL